MTCGYLTINKIKQKQTIKQTKSSRSGGRWSVLSGNNSKRDCIEIAETVALVIPYHLRHYI